MKKAINTDDIKPVDFSKGVRGKHHAACKKGYTVHVHGEDGKTVIHKLVPERGAIVLDKDIQSYFPNARAVNVALRGLLNLLPQRTKRARAA